MGPEVCPCLCYPYLCYMSQEMLVSFRPQKSVPFKIATNGQVWGRDCPLHNIICSAAAIRQYLHGVPSAMSGACLTIPVKFALIPASPWPPIMDGSTPSMPGLQAMLAKEGSELAGCCTESARGGPAGESCNKSGITMGTGAAGWLGQVTCLPRTSGFTEQSCEQVRCRRS